VVPVSESVEFAEWLDVVTASESVVVPDVVTAAVSDVVSVALKPFPYTPKLLLYRLLCFCLHYLSYTFCKCVLFA
jgi:hypothetical protein